MIIRIDADAVPGPVREVLIRAARRRGVSLVFVANTPMRVPSDETISFELVSAGADAADDRIVECCEPGDLVITADVPLAARVVETGAVALNPRGTLYTAENVGECLAMRDLMDSLRSAGLAEGGPSGHGSGHTREFADALDRFLTAAGL